MMMLMMRSFLLTLLVAGVVHGFIPATIGQRVSKNVVEVAALPSSAQQEYFAGRIAEARQRARVRANEAAIRTKQDNIRSKTHSLSSRQQYFADRIEESRKRALLMSLSAAKSKSAVQVLKNGIETPKPPQTTVRITNNLTGSSMTFDRQSALLKEMESARGALAAFNGVPRP